MTINKQELQKFFSLYSISFSETSFISFNQNFYSQGFQTKILAKTSNHYFSLWEKYRNFNQSRQLIPIFRSQSSSKYRLILKSSILGRRERFHQLYSSLVLYERWREFALSVSMLNVASASDACYPACSYLWSSCVMIAIMF